MCVHARSHTHTANIIINGKILNSPKDRNKKWMSATIISIQHYTAEPSCFDEAEIKIKIIKFEMKHTNSLFKMTILYMEKIQNPIITY